MTTILRLSRCSFFVAFAAYSPVWLLVCVLACGLSACSEADPKASPKPRSVRTHVVRLAESSEELSSIGEIRPNEETTLGFRLDGRLLSRGVDIGRVVKAGQLIAALDPRDSENQLRSAKADLAVARASEKLAESNLKRTRAIVQSGAMAQAQLEEAEANWQTAHAKRESADAQLKSARERLGFTHLYAPTDGVITAVSANVGQVVNAGQEVVKLASLGGKDAVFDIPTSTLVRRQDAPEIKVSLLAEPRIQVIGHVRDLNPQADPVTRTYRVRVALDNPPPTMVLGATVMGTVHLAGAHLVSIQASALTRKENQPAVYVVDPASSRLVLRPVQVAHYLNERVWVSEGLSAGERVVTAGVSRLFPGLLVSIDREHHG